MRHTYTRTLLVFSAHAEVVPVAKAPGRCRFRILRARGGSSCHCDING